MEIIIVLTLLVGAVVLFATEALPVDIVTWLVLILLILAGILTPAEAFAGFSSDILIILASVFVISAGLRESGIVDRFGERLQRLGGDDPNRFLAILMGTVAGFSAFMNNTTVTALTVAPVIGAARSRGLSPSRFLMPLAFASILGGTCTLIGTSTNVAVSGYLAQTGLEPIGFFEFTGIGLVIVVTGIAYMIFVGQRLLPQPPEVGDLAEDYSLREYLSEIVIREGSPMVGQALRDSDLGALDFRVLQILRGDVTLTARPNRHLRVGDVLLVSGPVASLVKVREIEGIDIHADAHLSEEAIRSRDQEILEILVTPESRLRNARIEELDLPARFGISVLAVNRHGQRLMEKIKTVRLQTGDILLVQGSREQTTALRERPDVAVLGGIAATTHPLRRGLIVFGLLLAAVVLSSLQVVPLALGFLAAAVAVVLIRALPASRAYDVIEWRLLVLIAGMTAFGTAMEKTGAADLLAGGIVSMLAPLGVWAVLAGFVVLTVLLTQPMSNAAAALVVVPVAIQSAILLDANPRTFAVAVALGASVSLITPFEPSCLLVYGAGKYQFLDFVKTGGLLTVILVAIVLGLVPVFWPL